MRTSVRAYMGPTKFFVILP